MGRLELEWLRMGRIASLSVRFNWFKRNKRLNSLFHEFGGLACLWFVRGGFEGLG